MKKIKEFLHPQMIIVLLFVVVSLVLFTIRINLNYSDKPTAYNEQKGTKNSTQTVPNPTPQKGREEGNVKPPVPTTVGTTYTMTKGQEIKNLKPNGKITVKVQRGLTVTTYNVTGNVGEGFAPGEYEDIFTFEGTPGTTFTLICY